MVEANVWKLSNILTPSITEKFEIPRYQRGYAWETKQVEDFCEDLWETNQDTTKVHPFGTIYCEEDRENNTVIIVDGQQRITTSMIFLCVARDWADELLPESKEADNMNDSLFRFDAALRKVDEDSPRLKLGRANKDYFRRRVLPRKLWKKKSTELDKTDNDSCDQIRNSYRTIRKFLVEHLGDDIDGAKSGLDAAAKITKLNFLFNTLLHSFEVVKISVPSQLEAYHMFSTINNRGIQLAEADMIKHTLFGELENEIKSGRDETEINEKLDQADDEWTETRNKITNRTEGAYDLTNFIHHYVVAFRDSTVKKNDVFTAIEKWVAEDGEDASKILSILLDWGYTFYNLRKPESFFSGKPKAAYYLQQINDTDKKALYAPILAGYDKLWSASRHDDFVTLLEILFKFHVRNKTICGVGATPLDECLRKVTKHMNETSSEELKLQDVLDILINDERVHQNNNILDQRLMSFSCNKQIAGFLLKGIEEVYDPDKKIGRDASVEHIMPTSKTHWKDYIMDKEGLATEDEFIAFHSKYKNYLGNQTLLTLPKNQSVSNKPFIEKKAKYIEQGYHMTQEIAQSHEWTSKEILETQERYKNHLMKLLDLQTIL